jgi:hypothetical protein
MARIINCIYYEIRNNVESRAEKDFQTSDTTQRQLLMNKREKRFSFPI